jgi:Flp pilus assembly protein TadD
MDPQKNHAWIKLAIVLALGLALAALIWLGRPAYRNYKQKREAAQAQAFLAAGDFRNAQLCARLTLQLNPTNVPACRVMAALADLSHSPAVLDWQRRIVQTEPTTENKLQLAAAGLRYQNPPFPLTAQILEELAATATNLVSYQLVAANLALNRHQLDGAEIHFQRASELEPTNQFHQLYLAIVRLDETNEMNAAAARTVLEKLQTDATLGPTALRALVADRLAHQDAAAANDLSTQLLATAHATLDDRLQQLYILRQLKSADFPARLQTVQQSATNAPAVAKVSAWMQANELLTENIRWLTNLPATLQAQQPFRVALANAYLQGEDWQSLRGFASQGNWEEMEFLRLALVSRAWSQLGVQQVADSNWGSAVNETGDRFGALTMLLQLTERWHLQSEQADLLRRMIEKFPQERWAQHALEQIYLAEGNTAGLQQLYARLFSVFPKDIGLENNLAATSLLLKTNLPQACRWAAEIYANRTNDLVIASTYAFALHLQGRTKDGLAIMQKLNDEQLAQPDAALYYGVLLVAAGATNEAAPFLKIAATKTQWLPEEKKLLATALGEN